MVDVLLFLLTVADRVDYRQYTFELRPRRWIYFFLCLTWTDSSSTVLHRYLRGDRRDRGPCSWSGRPVQLTLPLTDTDVLDPEFGEVCRL